MLVFAAAMVLGGCRSCDSVAMALPAAGGGMMWLVAAALRRAGPAAGVGVFLVAGHVGLVLSTSVTACVLCLVLLGAESVAAGLLLSQAAVRRPRFLFVGALLAAAGLVGGWGTSRLVWGLAGPDPVLEEVLRSSSPNETVVLVVVSGDCGRCPDGVGLARAVEESGKARAVIVQGWTASGRWLRGKHGLSRLPAFVAWRAERVVAVQSGGGVEEFLARLGR